MSEDQIRLLIIEDSEDDTLLLLRELQRGGFQMDWQRVETAEALQQAIAQSTWDVIVSDYHLPGFDAMAALDIVNQNQLDLPFIVVSGTIGDTLAVELMKSGAHDYLLKGKLTRLPEVLRREIREARVRQEQRLTTLELDRTKERLQLAIAGAGISTWDWDIASGQWVVNERWANLLGYSLAELAPVTFELWQQRIHPDDWPAVKTLVHQHLRGDIPTYNCEFRMRHRSDQWRWFSTRGKVVEWDAEGNPQRMTGTHSDITERKQANLRLEMQNAILERIAQSDPLPDILEALVCAVEAQLEGGLCSILLCEFETTPTGDRTGYLRHGAAPSLPAAYCDAINGVMIGEAAGSCGTAAFCRDIVIVSDIATDPLWSTYKHLALKHGLRSCWSVPALASDGEVLATFAVYYKTCKTPQDRELETIALAANIAKIAIERHRDTEALAQLNRQLEERVEQRTTALKESESKLDSILNFAPEVVYVKDLQGRHIFVNRAFLKLFGCTKTDVIGKTNREFYRPEIADQFDANDQEVITTRQFQQYEERLQIGDRTYTFLSNKFVLRDRHGDAYAICGISTDISDRRQYQDALQRSEKRTRATLKAIPDLVFRLDHSYRYVDFMASKQVKLLVSPATVVGKTLWESVPPEVALRHQQATQQALTTQTVQTFVQEIYVDGEVRYEDVRVAPCGDNEVVFLVRDISERKKAEAALRRSEARFQRIVANVPGAIYQYVLRVDGSYAFTYMSNRCRSIYGVEPSTVEENADIVFDMVAPEQQAWLHQSIQRSAETLTPWQWEGQIITPSGQKKWIQGMAQPEIQPNGDILWDGLVFDVSDRKAIESQLQRTIDELAQATRLKDEFLANMSHELRTPLNAILGMSEGLQEGVFGAVNKEQQTAIATVEKSGKHLLELISDILDLSKIEAGKLELTLEDIPIRELCESSLAFVRQMAYKKQIALHVKIPASLEVFTICADNRRMRQVLINLLSNAVKFTHDGGSVQLSVRLEPVSSSLMPSEASPPEKNGKQTSNGAENTEAPDAPVHSVQNVHNEMCFAVTDTGIGIAPENMHKLFQSFMQIDNSLSRQHAGTGLGLALVQKITALHGGRLEVSSRLHQGSCFTVRLPYTPSSPLSQPTQANTTNPPPASTQAIATAQQPLVLLAEDNAANVMTISAYLKAKGYHILVVNDGEAAIAAAQTHHPDIILMDLQMPTLDGLTAIRKIRKIPSLQALPIIALTAFAMKGDHDKCLAAGANDYMTKPVKLKQLVARIQNSLATAIP